MELEKRIAAQRALVGEAEAKAHRVKEIAAKLRTHETESARRRAESELAQKGLEQREEIAERAAQIDRRAAEEETSRRAVASALAELGVEARGGERALARAGVALEAARADDLLAPTADPFG